MQRWTKLVVAVFAGLAVWVGVATRSGPAPARAADHGDAPNVDGDSGADIADVFLFLDPNDNTKVCVLGTIHGFITPGEAQNFGTFDANVQYRFDIENTGDFKADQSILITFDERTAAGSPQTATVRLPNRKTFTAQTTPPTLSTQPTTQNVQLNVDNTGVDFFAGIVDDPFFFDIPGFQRFVATVRAGTPDATKLTRGRDTFAGYNVMGIALRMPLTMLQSTRPGATTQKIGAELITSRKTQTVGGKTGAIKASGKFRQADRMGNPAVNVALIPFTKKSSFNTATPKDDAAGKFQADILASLAPFHGQRPRPGPGRPGDHQRRLHPDGPGDPQHRAEGWDQPRSRLPQRPAAGGRHDRHHPDGHQQRQHAGRQRGRERRPAAGPVPVLRPAPPAAGEPAGRRRDRRSDPQLTAVDLG